MILVIFGAAAFLVVIIVLQLVKILSAMATTSYVRNDGDQFSLFRDYPQR